MAGFTKEQRAELDEQRRAIVAEILTATEAKFNDQQAGLQTQFDGQRDEILSATKTLLDDHRQQVASDTRATVDEYRLHAIADMRSLLREELAAIKTEVERLEQLVTRAIEDLELFQQDLGKVRTRLTIVERQFRALRAKAA